MSFWGVVSKVNFLDSSVIMEVAVWAIDIVPFWARKTLNLEFFLSTFNTFTFSVPIPRISFSPMDNTSTPIEPATLKYVTSPVAPVVLTPPVNEIDSVLTPILNPPCRESIEVLNPARETKSLFTNWWGEVEIATYFPLASKGIISNSETVLEATLTLVTFTPSISETLALASWAPIKG